MDADTNTSETQESSTSFSAIEEMSSDNFITEKTESTTATSADNGPSAGAMLKTLRENAGMEQETLAAALKINPQRLSALESDDYSALPALYFARGLAANICRHLGQDAAPVLAKMPDEKPKIPTIPRADAPMRGQAMPPVNMGTHSNGILKWIILGLVLLGLVVGAIFAIPRLRAGLNTERQQATATPPTPASTLPASAVATATTTLAPATTMPALVPAASGATEPSAPARNTAVNAVNQGAISSSILQINALGNTWVKVSTPKGLTLFEGNLIKDQQHQIHISEYPVNVVIGKAENAQIIDRGHPFDLSGITSQGIARFEIKS